MSQLVLRVGFLVDDEFDRYRPRGPIWDEVSNKVAEDLRHACTILNMRTTLMMQTSINRGTLGVFG